MVKEANSTSVNKYLYKTLLLILKVIPMVTAIGYLLNTILIYIGVDAAIFSYLFGMSLLTWLYILISTIVFRFCIYHRMFLYYILSMDCLNTYDDYVGIPVSDVNLITIHFILAGIFLFLILYFHVRCNKKSTN